MRLLLYDSICAKKVGTAIRPSESSKGRHTQVFKNLFLNRPLAVIDLETTGTDPKTDRIVEIGVVKIFPDGSRDDRCRRVNPGVPIPEAATAIHGITDADVKDTPTFEILVPGLVRFLDGCDLCGFNLKRFDVLDAMLDRYPDLPRSLDEFHEALRDERAADLDGKFIMIDGQVTFNFGKFKGRHLDQVAQESARLHRVDVGAVVSGRRKGIGDGGAASC